MMAQASLTDRMLRAAKGDVNLYAEVEKDTNATSQAATVVIIVAVASAIGAAVASLMLPAVVAGVPMARNPVGVFIQQLIGVPIGWILWSYITYFVGTRLFGGTATPGEMLRCIGFAYSPQVLSILQVIPVLGALISLAVFIWSFWLAIVAIRQGLNIDTGKAIGTAIVGAIVAFVALAVIGSIVALITAPFAMMAG